VHRTLNFVCTFPPGKRGWIFFIRAAASTHVAFSTGRGVRAAADAHFASLRVAISMNCLMSRTSFGYNKAR
jgi:hypothetical protein